MIISCSYDSERTKGLVDLLSHIETCVHALKVGNQSSFFLGYFSGATGANSATSATSATSSSILLLY